MRSKIGGLNQRLHLVIGIMARSNNSRKEPNFGDEFHIWTKHNSSVANSSSSQPFDVDHMAHTLSTSTSYKIYS